ncbi:thiol:disulfide interchange protein DsbA [Izhakiella capsodis]|uniref:Thiol:disulfide interchange protein DsbA n=1 Tax=Izhakiella capsodis TaxID=1367852 RepID=A0A1I4XFI9_9GAMM|nr:DsbA family protein [Izhakiella capsodis]SFN24664.1 thiol:disulfide interchange protein DsbA [Izhakiella capsodis]
MKKRIFYVLMYTVFIAVISALITTAWFHAFVLNQTSEAGPQVLRSLSAEKQDKSPIADGDDIVEIFSYGCHFCEMNERNVAELKKRMPAGKKFIRLHLSLDSQAGLARYAPVFATLEAMGIESTYRQSAYNAVIKDKIDLGDPAKLDAWLEKNKINVAEYHKVSQSKEVKDRLDYMTRVTQYYNINATPTFIINKKWIAIQDRDFPAFADKLLSIMETGKAPE